MEYKLFIKLNTIFKLKSHDPVNLFKQQNHFAAHLGESAVSRFPCVFQAV